MDTTDISQELSDAFHAVAWGEGTRAPALVRQEIVERLSQQRIEELVAEQDDETLALALQQEFFRDEVHNELYARFGPRILSWLRGWGVTTHDAEDLFQQVMLQCWKTRLVTFQATEDDSLAAYLRTMTRNARVGLARKRALRTTDYLEAEDASADPAELAELAEWEAFVLKAREDLADPLREVIDLLLEGRSRDEMATLLRLKKTTVCQRLCKARKRLAVLAERQGFQVPPAQRGRRPQRQEVP